jgi:hypothetical protein
MYQPQAYAVASLFMLGSAFWWGSWANTVKFTRNWAFQLFYWDDYAIAQGATMISAIWGVFVWREFASSPASAKRLLPYMFFGFVVGLAMIAVAPLF